MPEANEQVPLSIPETGEDVVALEVSAESVVMCHRYPDMECRSPEDCPKVYAKCWQTRIWNR